MAHVGLNCHPPSSYPPNVRDASFGASRGFERIKIYEVLWMSDTGAPIFSFVLQIATTGRENEIGSCYRKDHSTRQNTFCTFHTRSPLLLRTNTNVYSKRAVSLDLSSDPRICSTGFRTTLTRGGQLPFVSRNASPRPGFEMGLGPQKARGRWGPGVLPPCRLPCFPATVKL